MVVGDMNICTGAHRGPMYGLLAEAMAGAGVGVGEYPIVTPVRGELKTNRPYGLSLSGFYFYRGPVTGVTIGYSPRCAGCAPGQEAKRKRRQMATEKAEAAAQRRAARAARAQRRAAAPRPREVKVKFTGLTQNSQVDPEV